MIKNNDYIMEANEIFRELAGFIKIDDVSKIPSESTIFKVLSTISYDNKFVGEPIGSLCQSIINLSVESTAHTPAEKNLISDKSYTTYRLKYPEVREIKYNDLIWLHFSLTQDGALLAFSDIQRILTELKMSYHLKVSKYLGPDIIVLGLYKKEDVRTILDACANSENIQEAIMFNNPFMPHENGIGVVKEIEGRSYTHQVSYLLHKYTNSILNIVKRETGINLDWFSFPDFIAFVSNEFNKSKETQSIFDRYLNYQVLMGLNSIYKDTSYLDEIDHLRPIEYDKDFYGRYKMSYENKELMYTDNEDNIVSESNNYILWLKLQAHSCLERMYFEINNEIPKENEKTSPNLTGYLSNIDNCIMSKKPFYGVLGYKDEMIRHLFPYLVAYNAYVNKMANIREAKYIVSEVSKKTVFTTRVPGDNKDFYTVNGKTFPSTIPPIRIAGQLIGIEYIDYESNYCNIAFLKNEEVHSMLGVFLDADKEKLWGEKLPGASLYRAVLGQILVNDNLQKEKIERNGRIGDLLKIENSMRQLSNISSIDEAKQY